MSCGQSGNPFAENSARATRVGAEELAEAQDQDERTTAERGVSKNAAIAAVNALRELTADRTRGGSGPGRERDGDQVGCEDEIRR
jgi:hypothetical protein